MEQEQTQTPLKCPRCNSLNTKFRYFNNNNRAQPRHYCRTCKRPWTAGGNLRDIPIGGKPRGRQTRASSSRFGSRFLLPQRPLISGEQLQNPQHTSPNVATVPRIFDPNMTQSVLNQPVPISPLGDYYLNDDISCLYAIQSLIEPEVWNQPVSDGNQFGNGTADLAFMQDWAIQPMTTPQVLPQEIPGQIETYQVPYQANVEAAYSLTNHSLVPNWPINSFLQEDFNDFDFPISDPCLWNNSSGSVIVTDTTTTSDNPNQWPNFPAYGPP